MAIAQNWRLARTVHSRLRASGCVLVEMGGAGRPNLSIIPNGSYRMVVPRPERKVNNFTEEVDTLGAGAIANMMAGYAEGHMDRDLLDPFIALGIWMDREGSYFSTLVDVYDDIPVARDMAQFNKTRAVMVDDAINWGTELFA